MEWFERWFGEEYLLVYEHRNIREAERETQVIKAIIGLQENDLVLDLCCGPGRHDNFFATMGCRIIGIDFSMPMLKIASEAIAFGKKYPQYIRGDARKLPFRDEVFDVVLNLFTSFGYFDDTENNELIKSISRILKPGGKFYIDYLNPKKVLSELVEESTKEKNGITIVEKRKHNTENHRIEKTIILSWDNNSQVFHESVRLYTLEEMLIMVNNAGLRTDSVLGSIEKQPYNDSSERMIIFGSKP
jgi:ubiquinone/menaquinone biosynthesis C-methylase UbiE